MLEFFFVLGTSLAISFVRELRNLTIIYKPNSSIYHMCQVSSNISGKRIRWHFQSPNSTENFCENQFNDNDCFEFYYGPSTSLLVVKDIDLFSGKYSCHVTMSKDHHLSSSAWIDTKLPPKNMLNENRDEQINNNLSFEKDSIKLARDFDVPFITDQYEIHPYGQRVEIGGIFHTYCPSIVTNSLPTNFAWLHLNTKSRNRSKSMRFVHDDQNRIRIRTDRNSSSFPRRQIYRLFHSKAVDFRFLNDFHGSTRRSRRLHLYCIQSKRSILLNTSIFNHFWSVILIHF